MLRKILIIVGYVLPIALLVISCFCVYVLFEKNEYLHLQIKEMQNKTSENYKYLLSVDEKISIIDESIDVKNKRWAKAKRIRSIVQDDIKKSGYINLNINQLTDIAYSVVDFSEQYDIKPSLILAIIKRESAFSPIAVSHAGAQGLMQIVPSTAREISYDIEKRYYNMFKIHDNIQFGTWYISKLMNYFKDDLELVVKAYNCGPVETERVLSGEHDKYPSETILYYEYVIKYMKEYDESLKF